MVDEKAIETVARAIRARKCGHQVGWEFEVDDAIAAITALQALSPGRLGSRLTVDGVEAVVVPVEASTKMRLAGSEIYDQRPPEAEAIYSAMLSAAGER
ncbi:hypothetical protein DK26_15265 [Bosea sp. WAO]|uniref:hypothetical protein n=1 Tax=Bosea sp. WAO TaxID=406341 RepID=UPI00074A7B4C|nr:hypothetical protein [Bosea sp. WAO]KUL94364.1 hypothetical protein DK26_15265 [Bosea sp. WAO]